MAATDVVLDASVALAWWLPETAEAKDYARRIDLDAIGSALDRLEAIEVVIHHYPYTSRALIDIAVKHHLQVADALYFHLAKIYGLPLATLDGGLRTAAKSHGVKLFAPQT